MNDVMKMAKKVTAAKDAVREAYDLMVKVNRQLGMGPASYLHDRNKYLMATFWNKLTEVNDLFEKLDKAAEQVSGNIMAEVGRNEDVGGDRMSAILRRLDEEKLDVLSDYQLEYLRGLYTNLRLSSKSDNKRVVDSLIKKGIYAGSKDGLVLTEKGKKVFQHYGIKQK